MKQEVVKESDKQKTNIKIIRHSSNVRPVRISRQESNGCQHRCSFDGCDKKFKLKSVLMKHENLAHLKLGRLYCRYPHCIYSTYNKTAFDRHIESHRDYTEVTSKTTTYVCDFEGCDKEFAQKKSWYTHRFNGHKNFGKVPCTHTGCTYAAISKSHLKIHMMKHSEGKPFLCEVQGCGKRFKREVTYKNHLDIHKNKYFKCSYDECGKTFESRSGLDEHKQSFHIKDKLYSCEWPGCEFKTYCKNNYRGHQKVHSNQRYSCDYPDCNKIYKDKSILRAHQLKKHGIGEGYECSWTGCQHKAISNIKLKIHEKSHKNNGQEGQQE